MPTLLCYSKCSTCREIRKILDDKNFTYDSRDIKENHPSSKEIASWHRASKLPLKCFFNTSGGKYRELGLKDKLVDMSEQEQYELLATDGMLVKRPILIDESKVLVGPDVKSFAENLEG